MDKVKAELDSDLKVKIIQSTPMVYRKGANESIDRPPHVRAASGVAHFAEYIAIVQDDANFLVLIEDDHRHVHSLPLPAGPKGNRVFGQQRGNTGEKLDLEGCVNVPGTQGDRLLSLGSGSSEKREWILLVELYEDEDDEDIELIDADRFFSYLRSETDFCGSGLNVEGVIFDNTDTILLFNRGNSGPKDGLEPVDATAELSWSDLKKHLDNPEEVNPPTLTNITQYDLGEVENVPLTFSDGIHLGDDILFSASAEAREDDYIAGSSIGIINDNQARWAEVIDEDGTAFEGKIEGLIVDQNDWHTIYFVIDDDQADQPSEIFEAKLQGPWF